MLFIFEEEQRLRFWMKDMRFPLDMIWIDAECRLVSISRDVPTPPPSSDDSNLPRYGPGIDVRFVLEINAGEAAGLGLNIGDGVEFLGSIDGKYEC